MVSLGLQTHHVIMVKFKTLYPECFLPVLQCEDSQYKRYPSICPTNKAYVGSGVTNEKVTTLFIIPQPVNTNQCKKGPTGKFQLHGFKSGEHKFHILYTPLLFFCHQKLSPNARNCKQTRFDKWCQYVQKITMNLLPMKKRTKQT